MGIRNNNKYRSLAKFWYKDKYYHMFANDQHKLAFLEIDDNGKYHSGYKEIVEELLMYLNQLKEQVFKANKRKEEDLRSLVLYLKQ